MLSHQKLLELSEQMPLLSFIPEQDCAWIQSDLTQAYLDFYRINFAREFDGLLHGFGCVEAAGFRIATHYWLPLDPRGTLVINHGLYDHVGIYNHAIRFALSLNFAVLAFDLPGHGLSSGEPADISSFDQYADVLALVLMQGRELMPRPLHGLSQSTGAAMMLNYLWRYPSQNPAHQSFSKIVLCAPLIVGRGWGLGQFLYLLLKPFVKKLKRGVSNNSHSTKFIDFITYQDPLQAKYLTLKWIGAMKSWNQQFSNFSSIDREVFIVQGTGDMTVAWRYNLPLIKSKLPNAKIHMITDARHQLVSESDEYRSQAFDAIEKYLKV